MIFVPTVKSTSLTPHLQRKHIGQKLGREDASHPATRDHEWSRKCITCPKAVDLRFLKVNSQGSTAITTKISQKQKKTFESPKKDSVDGWWKHDNIWIYLITSSHLLWTLFQHATLLLQRLMWHYDMADNAQLASYITVILPLWLRNSDANTSPLLDPLSKTNSPGRKVFRSKQKEKHAALGWPAACIIQPSVVRRKGTRSPRVVAPGLYRDALKKLWMLSQQQEGVPNSS